MAVCPEVSDDTEEQFESTLVSSAKPEYYRSIELGPLNEATENAPQKPMLHDREPEKPTFRTGIAQRRAIERDLEVEAGRWRDSIGDKLEIYRSRRGRARLSGQYTMQLDFQRTAARAVFGAVAAAAAPAPPLEDEQPDSIHDLNSAAPTELPQWGSEPSQGVPHPPPSRESANHQDSPAMPQPASEPVAPPPPPKPPKRSERKIIEFPRLFPAESVWPQGDELAEPVFDRPRIIDVPEETDQIELPLGDIQFEAAVAPETERVPEISTPVQVASVSQRVFASITDSFLVLAATAMFVTITLYVAGSIPPTKLVLATSLLVPCVFWGIYHYLFLVHAAATPGMHLAQLRLATFDGRVTDRHIRRFRALAMFLSCASAGLGFAWAFVDEDTLCWHDRISRTYLAGR